jgi:primosomal protein N' (replication factor Y)
VPLSARNVARVAVDLGHPHLDRLFDYRVPEHLDEAAQSGVRVRVRFAGRLVGGFLVQRTEQSAHAGTLAALHKVVSPEVVLPPRVVATCRAVADHYAGTLADVLRLAVPPRHARTEREPVAPTQPAPPVPAPGGWQAYATGPSLLDALAAGARPHAVVSAVPGSDWPDLLARAALATAAAGRGSVVVLPDVRDVALVDACLRGHAGASQHVVLHADLGPSRRYRAFLAAARGQARIVVGTRSAVLAPVAELGLIAVWDDGDDLHAEPRAPYPHARDVALIRAHQEGAALVLAGLSRTAEAARLVRSGWAGDMTADRTTLRRSAPLVRAAGEDPSEGRLPRAVFRAVREGVAVGPVLVQVPRRGYRPATACARCRTLARCRRCGGPVAQALGQPPRCTWCSASTLGWACPACGAASMRAIVIGSERTAEELGRAFPGVTVRQSGLGHVLADVPATPALVVATPGAEPVAAGGYSAAVLLDGAALLHRPDLRAAEEALRRWMGAAALVRPGPGGGRVVVVAPSDHRAVQALVRWAPGGFADAELDDREAVLLPPAVRVAELTGAPADVEDMLALAGLPVTAEVLGPVVVDGSARALVRAPLSDGTGLAAALHAASAVRSARRSGGPVRVRIDPVALG